MIYKKAFFWNMIGSTIYSLSSFLYLLVITRVCGVEIAGFYSLSYATAQLLLQVGRYGMRTYQATDLNQKYLFSEYIVSRIFSCGMMMLLGIIYSGISFDNKYIIISCFIIFMKSIDAIEDVFHGNFQQKFHVETMGKMLAIRSTYSAVVFTVILFITENLLVTCAFSSISSFIVCLLVNGYFTKKQLRGMEDGNRNFHLSSVLELLKGCTPLFMGTFLSLLLYNVPKYAMSGIMSDEYQTYYSVLFMPTFVITLLCEFVFKPNLTTITEIWNQNNTRKFVLYVGRILGIVVVFCGVVVVGGHFLGRTLLEMVYGIELDSYKLHFIILLISGGISSGVYILYNILIAIRKGNCILAVYSFAAVITILQAKKMVQAWGVMGAVLNYLLSCSILFVLFLCILTYFCFPKRKEK